MADIKTNLRELSVLVGCKKIFNNSIDIYDSKKFYDLSKEIVGVSGINNISNISSIICFDNHQREIIRNGYNLALKIVELFKISNINNLKWFGFDTQKESPIDVMINEYSFSLKEESFILENMGLYKLVNCFTGSNHKTLHIFEDFAMSEYKDWFNVTWGEMIVFLNKNNNVWKLSGRNGKESRIELQENKILFDYFENGKRVESANLPFLCNLEQFKSLTSSRTREQVFSKFINDCMDYNANYLKYKKVCAEKASENLATCLTMRLNYNAGLARFLRIYDESYFYAKTTNKGIDIYMVPSVKNFQNTIGIESIVASVPKSQANILTTIRNKYTGQKLVLRNECRFSHGQFNGTPEAKMYYESGGSLLVIYQQLS